MYSLGNLRPVLTFETHLRGCVEGSQEYVCRAGKLLDCPRVLKSFFNAYILPSFEYCTPLGMLSVVSFGFA